jgi:DNA-3-methyladenine glycosylase I
LKPGHERIAKPSLADYLAVMSRAVFQAGLRWADIDRQWDSLRTAFDGFEPRKVARYGEADIRRIVATPGILHSERKIRATIENAGTMIELDRQYGGFRKYLRAHASYDDAVADLRRRFSYVGEISAYYFLFRVGETVPPFNRWIRTVKGDHPRIREMVAT